MIRIARLKSEQFIATDALIDYSQLLQLLKRHLPPSTIALFAKPKALDNGVIEWYSELGGQPVPLDDLAAADAVQVKRLLDERLESVRQLATQLDTQGPGGQQQSKMLRQAIRYPDSTTVYSLNGQPVLTFWGFGLRATAVPAPAKLTYENANLADATNLPPPMTQELGATTAMKKKRRNGWPLLMVVAVLAGVLYYYLNKSSPTTLTVHVEPADANIRVEGQVYSNQMVLEAGEVITLSVSAEGHESQTFQQVIEKGPNEVEVKLQPFLQGSLHIDVSPTDARIELLAPATAYQSAMKLNARTTLKLRISKAGFETREDSVTIAVGDNRLSYTLMREPEMVDIPEGSFSMGSNRFDDQKPIHTVTVKPFRLGTTEVTRKQFSEFAKETAFTTDYCFVGLKYRVKPKSDANWSNPYFSQTDEHPVVCVSWEDALAFIQWANRKFSPSKPYRLPSEAEWEYAARAGSTTQYPWGGTPGYGNANCDDTLCRDGFKNTSPVRKFPANAFGIYDMIGNVSEWTLDCLVDGYNGAPTAGSPQTEGDCGFRRQRGGSWNETTDFMLYSSYRSFGGMGVRSSDNGFRLAQDL